MKESKIKVLVIIVTYNAMHWAERCFTSLLSSTFPLDIFVVDNGSIDGTQEYIKTNYPNAILIQSKNNLGFGKANNLGLQYAVDKCYDYVYLLNQDAWVFSDTIERLIEISKKNPDYGILSPFQMNDNGQMDKNFYNRLKKSATFESLFNDIYNNNVKEIYDVQDIMAAHWFMPYKTILTVGGFSPSFSHYGEDDNYEDRMKYLNLKTGIVPCLKVVHDRAYRVNDSNKIIYIDHTFSIRALSNPMTPLLTSLLIAFKIAIKNMVRYCSLKPLGYLLKTFIRLRDIQQNKKRSMNEMGAFLSMPNKK